MSGPALLQNPRPKPTMEIRQQDQFKDHKPHGNLTLTQSTRTYKHVYVLGCGLKGSTSNHYWTTHHDRTAPSEKIRRVWSYRNGAERANGLNGAKQTEFRSGGMIKILFPLIKKLEAAFSGKHVIRDEICNLKHLLTNSSYFHHSRWPLR